MNEGLAGRLTHVFDWPARYPIRLLLPSLIVLSTGLHLALVYLVRTPPADLRRPLPPPAAKVVLVAGPEAAAVHAWLEMRDPAWMQPGRTRESLLPAAALPSRGTALDEPGWELPPLDGVDFSEASWVPPVPPLSVMPLPASASRMVQRPALLPAPPRGVAVQMLGGPDRLPASLESALQVLAETVVRGSVPPGATGLMILPDASGWPGQVFLTSSSGQPDLDRAAREAVRRTLFPPPAAGAREGPVFLTIHWPAPASSP